MLELGLQYLAPGVAPRRAHSAAGAAGRVGDHRHRGAQLTDSSPPRGRIRARGGFREVRTLDVVRMLTRILKSANMRHTI